MATPQSTRKHRGPDKHKRVIKVIPPEVKFWSRVAKTDSCWLWTGRTISGGYGSFRPVTPGRYVRAHRFSYELHVGPVPPGMMVCHDCPGGDNKGCVNPAHLFLGTNRENILDASKKGMLPHGETHHAAKLTDAQVEEIREMYSTKECSQLSIARIYGVSQGHVSMLVHNKTGRY